MSALLMAVAVGSGLSSPLAQDMRTTDAMNATTKTNALEHHGVTG